MNYLASVTDFFKSPKWGMNLLLGAVCFLIPYIGAIVLNGWYITGFWTRREKVDPAKFPDFDFGQFGKYLERGLWPFLVSLVIILVLLAILMVPILLVLFGIIALTEGPPGHEPEGMAVLLAVMVMFGMQATAMIVVTLIPAPFVLAATITQDFGRAFNFGFIKRFVRLVWKELILAVLFNVLVGVVFGLAGFCAFYFGIFAALVVSTFSWHHLEKQLYLLYLSRGGEALPPAPGLWGTPPTLPPTLAPPLPTPLR